VSTSAYLPFEKIVGAKRAEQRVKKIARLTNRTDRVTFKSLFIWIPKTAGTSVFTYLSQEKGMVKLKTVRLWEEYLPSLPSAAMGHVTTGHMDPDFLIRNQIASRENLETTFTFSVVRDPYERAISLYRYFQAQGRVNQEEDFITWLQRLSSKLRRTAIGPWNVLGHSQAKPQSDWLKPRLWRGPEVFKLEEPHLWPEHLVRATKTLPRLNASGVGRERINLDRAARKLIERIYHRDFDILEYPKIGPTYVSIGGRAVSTEPDFPGAR
jgi:hypothetical protein